jgi:hypothetical protein
MKKRTLFERFAAHNRAGDGVKAEQWVHPDIWGYEYLVKAFGSEAEAKAKIIDVFNTLRVFDHCIDLSADDCPLLRDLLEVRRKNQPGGYRSLVPTIMIALRPATLPAALPVASMTIESSPDEIKSDPVPVR